MYMRVCVCTLAPRAPQMRERWDAEMATELAELAELRQRNKELRRAAKEYKDQWVLVGVGMVGSWVRVLGQGFRFWALGLTQAWPVIHPHLGVLPGFSRGWLRACKCSLHLHGCLTATKADVSWLLHTVANLDG